MNAIDRLARAIVPRRQASDFDGSFTFSDWLSLFSLDSPLFVGASLQANEEMPPPGFTGMAAAYARNSVVFAVFMARAKLFSQARFQFQQMFGGHAGALFGTPALTILEHPEPGVGTGEMLMRAELDAMLAGDWFAVRRTIRGMDRLKRIRPDWTTLVMGSPNTSDPVEVPLDPDSEVIGIGYEPGGPTSNNEVITFGRDEFVHYHPNPNPLSRYRGLPLILSAIPEIIADTGATSHKRAFFRNGATPMVSVSFPPSMPEEKAKAWIKVFENKHVGPNNAYKALYLSSGVAFNTIGSTFQQMAYKELQDSFETRISAVAGIHPAIIALSEGLKGSSLNAGNFAAAARSTADITLRDLWMLMCNALEMTVVPRVGTRLWYDERSIPFLQADVQDRATARQSDMASISTGVSAGYTPDSARDAVIADDLSLLEHTGLPSVQLQPPPGGGSVAQTFPPSPVVLRHLMARGWTAATRADTEIIAMALGPSERAGRDLREAQGDFTPAGSGAMRYGTIRKGATYPSDHPLVLAYPSLFASPVTVSRPGPARLVSPAQIEAARQKLLGAGRPAGQASLALELNVSRDTVRRALTEA